MAFGKLEGAEGVSVAVRTCSDTAGKSATYTITVDVDAGTLGEIVNTAKVSSDTANTNDDDDATARVEVVPNLIFTSGFESD